MTGDGLRCMALWMLWTVASIPVGVLVGRWIKGQAA